MNKESEGELKVIAAFIAVCIIWGSTYLAMRIGVSEFPPELFAGIRFFIAGMIMLCYSMIKKQKFPETLSDVRKISLVGVFLLLGGNGLVIWAEQWVHSGIASLLVATVPLFMAILEFMVGKSSLDLKGWIGLLVGFCGVGFLVFSGAGAGAIDLKGSLFLLAASLLWAIGSVYSKKVKVTGSIVSQISIQMLVAGVGLCILGIGLGELEAVRFTYKGVGALLYLIFFGSILGYSCYIYILQKWSAGKAGTYAYVNPVVAVLLGAVVLGEKISFAMVISAIIILASVLLVQLSKSDPKG